MVDETDGRSKPRRQQRNELKELSKALKESNAQQEQISRLDGIRSALEGIQSTSIGGRDTSELKASFEKAAAILSNQEAFTANEIQLAQETLAAIQDSAQADREMQERLLSAQQAKLDEATAILSNQDSFTASEIQLAQETLAAIQESSESDREMQERLLASQQEIAAASLQQQFQQSQNLVAAFGQFNQNESDEDLIEAVQASLSNLEGGEVSGADFTEVENALAEAIEILQNPEASTEQQDAARDIISAIRENAGTEEERREAAKAAAKQASLLGKISSGIDAQKKAYDDFVGSTAGGGLIAALGAAAILFTDPETLLAGIQTGINAVMDTIDTISMFLEGDFAGGMESLKENFGSISGVFAAGVLILFRKFILGSLINLAGTLLTSAGTAIAGSLGGLATGFISTILSPVVAIPAAIAAAVVVFVKSAFEGISAGLTTYEETGSIGEALKEGFTTFAANLLGWPLDLLKDAFGFIVGSLGFEDTAADIKSFSFIDLFKDVYDKIFSVLTEAFDNIVDFFTYNEPGEIARKIPELIGNLINKPFQIAKDALASVLRYFGMEDEAAAVEDVTIPELIATVIDSIFNIPKKAFAWMLGKLGFDEEAEQVENFDIKAKVMEIIDRSIERVQDFFNSIGEIFDNFELPSVGDAIAGISEGFKAMLRSLLPDPTDGILTPTGALARLIPESVYEYAGIDKSTGEVVEPPVEAPPAPTSGTEIDQGSTAVTAAKEEAAQPTRDGAVNAVVTGGTSVSNSNVNYSTGKRTPRRSNQYNTANQ